jgi:hypothetical protein
MIQMQVVFAMFVAYLCAGLFSVLLNYSLYARFWEQIGSMALPELRNESDATIFRVKVATMIMTGFINMFAWPVFQFEVEGNDDR